MKYRKAIDFLRLLHNVSGPGTFYTFREINHYVQLDRSEQGYADYTSAHATNISGKWSVTKELRNFQILIRIAQHSLSVTKFLSDIHATDKKS